MRMRRLVSVQKQLCASEQPHRCSSMAVEYEKLRNPFPSQRLKHSLILTDLHGFDIHQYFTLCSYHDLTYCNEKDVQWHPDFLLPASEAHKANHATYYNELMQNVRLNASQQAKWFSFFDGCQSAIWNWIELTHSILFSHSASSISNFPLYWSLCQRLQFYRS